MRPAPLLVKSTDVAPRRVPVEPSRKPHHHTRRASERWAAATASRRSRRRAAPRAARHRYREPHGFVPPVLDGDAAARPPPARSQQSGYTLGPLRTRSVGLEPRAVRFGRVALRQKARPVDARHPHEGPKNPPGRCDFALLRPLKNPLRGSRPTSAVWAPRRRRPPDRSALLRFFDSQSNMGLPRHQRRPAPPPEPVGREGTTLGAHATVADALHVVGRRLGPQLHHSNGGVPPGADQSQRRRSPPSQPTHATRSFPDDVTKQRHKPCTTISEM